MDEINANKGVVIVSVINGENLPQGIKGKKKIYTADGARGDLGLRWIEDGIAEIVNQAWTDSGFRMAEIKNHDKNSQTAVITVDPYMPSPRLLIMGGGHIARPLSILCSMLGYSVTIVDDRPRFSTQQRFPGAEKVICSSFSDIANQLEPDLNTSIIIVTRGHQHDHECLRQFLNHPFLYIGMIGSKRRIMMIRKNLEQEGFDKSLIEKVFMPVGLDIGAQTPEEIAVSIAAELVNFKRGGGAYSLNRGISQKGEDKNNGHRKNETSARDNLEMLQMIYQAVEEGDKAVLATIVKTSGSTPRKAGARMLFFEDGHTFGSVGGGCGEAEVRNGALMAMDTEQIIMLKVEMNDDIAAEEGMVCGGTAEFVLEPINLFSGLENN